MSENISAGEDAVMDGGVPMNDGIPDTGDAAVAAALAGLEGIAELSTAEKLERLTKAQQALAEVLAIQHHQNAPATMSIPMRREA
ncbi:MAG: hypothetical protein LBH11_06315 [Propionibacteriaceae bacterium]|jgi:hypothetical protein|nr:hypothetical protein [Propionibacteriaceae bacterium]